MHDGMPYDPIQGQVKVTSNWKPLKRSRPSVSHGAKVFFLSFFFLFSSPNLSGRRLDVCHTSTHGVALVRI